MEHQKEFEKLYNQGVYDIDDVLYQCWLLLKIDANGTEEEVFQHILKSRTPSNIQKKVRKRKKVEPEGANKYDPLSAAWTRIYHDRGLGEETDDTNRKKITAKRGGRGSRGRDVATPLSSSSTVPSTSGLFSETSTPAVSPARSELNHPCLSGPNTTLMLTQNNKAPEIVELINIRNPIAKNETESDQFSSPDPGKFCLGEDDSEHLGEDDGERHGRGRRRDRGGRGGPGGHGGDDGERRGGGRSRGRRGGPGGRGGKREFVRKSVDSSSRTSIKPKESRGGNTGNFEDDVKVKVTVEFQAEGDRTCDTKTDQPTIDNVKVKPTRIQPKRIKREMC